MYIYTFTWDLHLYIISIYIIAYLNVKRNISLCFDFT